MAFAWGRFFAWVGRFGVDGLFCCVGGMDLDWWWNVGVVEWWSVIPEWA
jgi:hypothetical protein